MLPDDHYSGLMVGKEVLSWPGTRKQPNTAGHMTLAIRRIHRTLANRRTTTRDHDRGHQGCNGDNNWPGLHRYSFVEVLPDPIRADSGPVLITGWMGRSGMKREMTIWNFDEDRGDQPSATGHLQPSAAANALCGCQR
jgi:hypothetical protein